MATLLWVLLAHAIVAIAISMLHRDIFAKRLEVDVLMRRLRAEKPTTYYAYVANIVLPFLEFALYMVFRGP